MIRYKITGTSTKIEKLDIPRENITHIFVRKDPKSHLLTRYRKGAGERHFPSFTKANDYLIEILETKANSINEMLKLVKKDLTIVNRRKRIEEDRLIELNKEVDETVDNTESNKK